MKKQSLIKLAGLALAASLVFTGCGTSGDGVILGNSGNGVGATGGGTTATTTGGTTGFGLTGGSLTGGFGGSGGSSGGTTTTGTGNTGTGTGTTTGTSTGTGTGTGGFLGNVSGQDARSGLNNPTAMAAVTISGTPRLVVLDGFRLGANNGRLLVIDEAGTFDPATGGFPLIPVGANAGVDPNVGPDLDSPFDMITVGDALFLSVGFEQTNDGKIIRVDNFTQQGGQITADFTDITANFTPPINPTFMTAVGNINADGTGNKNYIYFTQYSPSGGGSNLVRRVSTDGALEDIVVNNLNFPAGIDHDGTRLAICDADGGAGGQVVIADLQTTITAPLNAGDLNDVQIVQPADLAVDGAISRTCDINYDGNNGFFFTEGGAIQSLNGPAPLGTANGKVRFIPKGSTTAQLVSSGLTNCAGLDAIDTTNNGTASVLFTEAININGRLLRREVTTSSITDTAPTVADTGINNPFFCAIASDVIPVLAASINYIGGQNNGILRTYQP